MLNHTLKIKSTKESGAVLITGLVFLVVLTIIVISALRSGTLEERMAANARDRQLALQAAEAVLRDAESKLLSLTPFLPFTPSSFTSNCAGGFCNVRPAGSTPHWQTVNWTTNSLSFAVLPASPNLTGLESQPRYIAELVSVDPKVGVKCGNVLFKLTARAVGNDSSIVIAQTMVRYLPATCPESV